MKQMETGKISEKIDRGKHTTRHSQLFWMEADSYIFDTPGFSSLELMTMEKEELRYSFPEFRKYEGSCRFQGCVHIEEPNCAVKQAVEEGIINEIGGLKEAMKKLYELIEGRSKK